MKRLLFPLIAGFLFLFAACNKCYDESTEACTISPDEIPDEACEALFTRWLYDRDKGTCEQVTYGGCNMYGFATKEECKDCKCD